MFQKTKNRWNETWTDITPDCLSVLHCQETFSSFELVNIVLPLICTVFIFLRWGPFSSMTLHLLDAVQKQALKFIGDPATSSPNLSLSSRWLFYHHFHSSCPWELSSFISPVGYPERSTKGSYHMQPSTLQLQKHRISQIYHLSFAECQRYRTIYLHMFSPFPWFSSCSSPVLIILTNSRLFRSPWCTVALGHFAFVVGLLWKDKLFSSK